MKQFFLQKSKIKTWTLSSKDTSTLVVQTNPETKIFFTLNIKHFSVIFLMLLVKLFIPDPDLLLFVNKSFMIASMIPTSISYHLSRHPSNVITDGMTQPGR